jgi:hypothetical protein
MFTPDAQDQKRMPSYCRQLLVAHLRMRLHCDQLGHALWSFHALLDFLDILVLL